MHNSSYFLNVTYFYKKQDIKHGKQITYKNWARLNETMQNQCIKRYLPIG